MTAQDQLTLLATILRGDCLHTCRHNICEECKGKLIVCVKQHPIIDDPALLVKHANKEGSVKNAQKTT